MAGDWIPIDHDLPDKPEVLAISCETGVEVAEVVLRLIRLWCWFDRMTEDGKIHGVGLPGVALRCGGDDQFWSSVQGVGWLKIRGKTVEIPRFSDRFGNSARRRLLAAKRVTLFRLGQKCNAHSVTEALQNASQEPLSVSVSEPVSEQEQEPLQNHKEGSSATPKTATAEPPPVLVFSTVGDGPKTWCLTPAKLAEYQGAFPDIDCLSEARKALQWTRDNQRKTARGMAAFLGRWMARAQDSTRGRDNTRRGLTHIPAGALDLTDEDLRR